MIFLTEVELQVLTGKKHRPAQMRSLRFMGIEHKIRPDGMVIVLRSHIEKLLDGDSPQESTIHIEPNWDGLKHGAKAKI